MTDQREQEPMPLGEFLDEFEKGLDTALIERAAIVTWLREAAEVQKACAVDLANAGLGDGFYSGDAYFRLTALADAIESGQHIKQEG